MSRDDQDDIRAFPRLPKQVKVELKELAYPMPTGPGEEARSKDISPAGICCISSTPFEPGTLLTATIHLIGWQRHKKGLAARLDGSALTKPLSVVAEVVWSRKASDGTGHETGIKFRDIADDDYQAIRKVFSR